jgi:tripartite-type tricarboxylate transporter receptor subunit TctC
MLPTRHWSALIAAVACLSISTIATAETYPARPVRVLTGFPPGGATDVIGRVLVDTLTSRLGQSFYLEGKPGAAGNVAGEILANAASDGYTLYLVGMGVATVNHALYGNLAYDPAVAFAPITLLVRLPLVLEVKAAMKVTTYQEFVALARSGARLNHGSPGIGTLPHLAAALFMSRIGFESAHIPYRGTGPFVSAMMQAEIDWAFDVPSGTLTLQGGGFIKPLAVTSAARYAAFPTVPTIVELGMPDLVMDTWFGLVAPAHTPRAIVEQLSREVAKAFAAPETAARLRAVGYEPATSTPDETTAIFAADRARWSAVVKANNIKAE